MVIGKNDNLVTAIIITHNRIGRLKRAIKSVLAQTYNNIELIIVNDGSKDGTREYLDELIGSNPEIKVIHHDIAKGACAARNSGIYAASGTYVAGLDDDDEWLPERIEKLRKLYSSVYSFAYASDCVITDVGRFDIIREGEACLDAILQGNIVGNQIFTETYKLRAIGGFDIALPAAQDWDVWIRLIQAHGVAIGSSSVLQNIYQENSDRISTSSRRTSGYWKLYCKHKNLMSMSHRATILTRLYISKNKILSFKVALVMLGHSVKVKHVLRAIFPKKIYLVFEKIRGK
jgi:glycosyltransferase involved in cell wall biosynthesis